MSQKNTVYKCAICGNVATILHAEAPDIHCCGQPMNVLMENTDDDAAVEKHVPVIEKTNTGTKVKVGSAPHPMEAAHFIEWIELSDGTQICRKFLSSNDKPEADFCLTGDKLIAKAYCNIHGFWKS